MMQPVLVMKPQDNVATCLRAIAANESVETTVGEEVRHVTVRDDVPFGHKFAIAPIEPGAAVIKYGEVIGLASMRIEAGDYVHVHNVESVRARGDRPAKASR